jgi:hypothetical protein
MPGRSYTQTQREDLSEWIKGIRPWEHSTGALTPQSKRRSSRNSTRHGYYKGVFREFRKNKRKPETLRIESMCLSLIDTERKDDVEKLSPIISDIHGSILTAWQSAEEESLDMASLTELRYVFSLCESVLRHSTSNVSQELRTQLKELTEEQQ